MKENNVNNKNKSVSKYWIMIVSLLILNISLIYKLQFQKSNVNEDKKQIQNKKDTLNKNEIKFCSGGGCAAKLGPKMLERVLSRLPKGPKDNNLLVGYESSDDASVYKISEDVAVIQTLDFFPPMIEDPYTFGKIAAANALSDIYAMGGQPVTALNIVCFPIKWDLNILGQVMKGGSEKVIEAGANIAGGHSINDEGVKYGLSVTGIINPKKLKKNYGAKVGDKLILTKPLGVGIATTAYKNKIIKEGDYDKMILSMTTLNKYALDILNKYNCHALTDVTGFGLLVHTSEMMQKDVSCNLYLNKIPLLNDNIQYYIEKHMITGASQRNEIAVKDIVQYNINDNLQWMKYLLLDPQTSGGLLCSLSPNEADSAIIELNKLDLKSGIIGDVIEKKDKVIYINE